MDPTLSNAPVPVTEERSVVEGAADRIIAQAPDLKAADHLARVLAGFHIYPKKSKLLLLQEVLLRESPQKWELRTLGYLAEEWNSDTIRAGSYYHGYEQETSAIEALRMALCVSEGYPNEPCETIDLAIARVWTYCRLFRASPQGRDCAGPRGRDCEMRWLAGQKCGCPKHLPSFGVSNIGWIRKKDLEMMVVTWRHLKQVLWSLISSLPSGSSAQDAIRARSVVIEEFVEFALPYSIGWLGKGRNSWSVDGPTSLPWLDDLLADHIAARRVPRRQLYGSDDMFQESKFFETPAIMFLGLYAKD
jgi:hypothetical protein